MLRLNVGDRVVLHDRRLRNGLVRAQTTSLVLEYGPDAIYEIIKLRNPGPFFGGPSTESIISRLLLPTGKTTDLGLSTERFDLAEEDITKMSVRQLSRMIRDVKV